MNIYKIMNLNSDLIKLILNYLPDVVYQKNLLLSNNKLYKLKPYILNNIALKKKFVEKNFSKDIANLFSNSLHNFPILTWKDRYCGSTGYLDQMRDNDIEYPIMIGIDNYKRSFIVISYLKKGEKSKYSCLDTLFQRFTNDKYTWTHGVSKYYSSLIETSGYFYNRGKMVDEKIKYKVIDLLKYNNEYVLLKPSSVM